MSDSPKVFRVTLEVADLEYATQLYGDLFGQDGQRHPGARHYFDCGGVIVAILDVSRGGMPPTPGPKSLSSRSTTSTLFTRGRTGSACSRPTTSTASQPASSPLVHGASVPSTSSIRGATICASVRTGRSIRSRRTGGG